LETGGDQVMLQLTFDALAKERRTVLCLGAHCDDIEIGCGGTILRLAKQYPNLKFHWVVFSSGTVRREEAVRGANRVLHHAIEPTIVIRDFRNGFFPYVATEIKEYFEELKAEVDPVVIFTHYKEDLHQDHRLLADLTWNTWRNHLILEYEIPKYDGGLGSPNLFVPVPDPLCRQKIDIIMECFATQRSKPWFTESTFLALMRLRGIESNADGGMAEAFYCRKLTV
jgi:LmbE family N-acetylglucosaminyl deacetylase